MRFVLPVMTAAALAASCGFANAQATNMYSTPAVAQTFGNADVPDRYDNQRLWNRPGYREPGYNAFGAGVGIGPVGVGIGPYGAGVGIGPFGVGVGPAYHAGYYGGPAHYGYYGSYASARPHRHSYR